MALVLNCFPVDLVPSEAILPHLDYVSWSASTAAKKSEFSTYHTWRYEIGKDEATTNTENRIRMVFLAGTQIPPGTDQARFDLGRFWRIGCILIEDALSAHFAKLGFATEQGRFERLALSRHSGLTDDALELSTGLAFSARRPFRDEKYRFTLTFQWVVRAMFRDSLINESLAGIALGLPVIYRPIGSTPSTLLAFENRYLGKVRLVDMSSKTATVIYRDDEPRNIPLRDLRLEASPAVIKIYEQRIRSRTGPSHVLRTMQQLKMSYTKENRRNVMASRDRLDQIRKALYQAGSSKDELIVPLTSFQSGSVSVALTPIEAIFGDNW